MAQNERLLAREYTFTAVFEPEPDGGYTVHFPALRGCITYGEALDEARNMAREALELYLENARSSTVSGLSVRLDFIDPVYQEHTKNAIFGCRMSLRSTSFRHDQMAKSYTVSYTYTKMNPNY